ncbi:MAG: SDR family NAD(P)-dependent oxidoreductase, partial [Kofleriaceae bacterium]
MRSFHARWIAACAIAEAIGIGTAALVAVVFATLLGPTDSTPRVIALLAAMAAAGAVEGGTLGFLQWRLLHERLPRLRRGEWVGITVAVAVVFWVAGMAGPALSQNGGDSGPGLGLTMILAAGLGMGAGAVFGGAQWFVLRHHARRSGQWIAIHVPAWAAAMAAIFLGATLPDASWSPAAIVVSGVLGGALGGVLLGAISGLVARALVPWVDERAWSASDKVCVITGADRGIGRETALSVARLGGTVVMLCRDPRAGERVATAITATSQNTHVHVVACDLTSLTSIRAAVEELVHRWPRIDVLINNAGAMFAKRTLVPNGPEGIEATLAVDAVGPFLLTTLLADRLSGGRVIMLTGIYHRRGKVELDDLAFSHRPYDPLVANNQAQAARWLFTVELARRYPHLTAMAVHPGAVLTGAQATLPLVLRWLIATILRPGFVRAELGATPVVRLAFDPDLDARASGRFFVRFRQADDVAPPELAGQWWQACATMCATSDPAN